MPPKPFKPPRPSTTTKKTPKPKPTTARKSTDSITKPRSKSQARASGSTSFSRPLAISSPAASDSDPFDSSPQDADVEPEEEGRTEHIPADLLTRLLHECFKEEGTRISKDANKAVERYMETFVREALARAAFMRAEGGERGFLEVSAFYLQDSIEGNVEKIWALLIV
jgi:centromere protein X